MNFQLNNNLIFTLLLCLLVQVGYSQAETSSTEERFDATLEKASRLMEERNYKALFKELVSISRYSKDADLLMASSDMAYDAAKQLDVERPILKPSGNLYDAAETLSLKAAKLYKAQKQTKECQAAHFQYRKALYMSDIRSTTTVNASPYNLLTKLPTEINKLDISFCR